MKSLEKIKAATSKEEAKKQLESLKPILPTTSVGLIQEQEAVLYHELDSKEKEVYEKTPQSFDVQQSVETYQHLDYKLETENLEEEKEVPVEPFFEKNPDFLKELEQKNKPNSKPIREKSASKLGAQKADPKIFSFWSASSNLGKRTISQSYAMQIAKLGYSVLYCEFDYLSPALAQTTALSNQDKNFYQLALSQDTFDLRQYIATKMDVKITKEMVGLFEEIPHEFHFLGLPSGFDPETFPSITSEDFLETLLSALKEIEYDAIVINLPSEIENLFGFPVMLESDVIFNVVSSNPVRISEYHAIIRMLQETPLDMKKWKSVINQVGQGISKETCDQMLREQSILAIPHDAERSGFELDLRFGSTLINQKTAELAGLFGFIAPETTVKKKGFFGLLGK